MYSCSWGEFILGVAEFTTHHRLNLWGWRSEMAAGVIGVVACGIGGPWRFSYGRSVLRRALSVGFAVRVLPSSLDRMEIVRATQRVIDALEGRVVGGDAGGVGM